MLIIISKQNLHTISGFVYILQCFKNLIRKYHFESYWLLMLVFLLEFHCLFHSLWNISIFANTNIPKTISQTIFHIWTNIRFSKQNIKEKENVLWNKQKEKKRTEILQVIFFKTIFAYKSHFKRKYKYITNLLKEINFFQQVHHTNYNNNKVRKKKSQTYSYCEHIVMSCLVNQPVIVKAHISKQFARLFCLQFAVLRRVFILFSNVIMVLIEAVTFEKPFHFRAD